VADASSLDAEHPWPWLEAFPESAQAFFNGRDQEKAALLRCVLSAPVTVLFGKSGLGKSSLLQAGLFPGLRAQRLLPVYRRIDHDANAADLSAQLAKRWAEEIHQTQADGKQPLSFRYKQPVDGDDEDILLSDDLWSDLHRDDIELVDSGGRIWQPVFVLDQFEEIFTRGAQRPERMQQWLFQLGDLLENRIPGELAEKLHDDDGWCEQLNVDVQPYRFLISLREDYLADLEEWSELIPRLTQNRFRLAPMSRDQAIQAIERTGASLVSHQDAKNIVQYLSQAKNQTFSCTLKTRGPGQIEPALLGLLCAGLNEERLRAGQATLHTDNLAQAGGQIVERFYDQALQGLPAAVGEFVEQFLITADGVRLAYPADSIVAEKRVSPEHLQTVIDRRLLRRESLESGERIELVHDRLAQVALRRRQDGQRRRALEKEQRRRRQVLFGGISVFLALLLFSGYMAWLYDKAKSAESKSRRSELTATAIRLAVEGGAITSGSRTGSDLVGLLKVLAGYRSSRLAGRNMLLVDETLQKELSDFRELKWLQQVAGEITAVALSPDGRRIVSINTEDGKVYLWDAASGKPVGAPINGFKSVVMAIALSPDSRRVVSGTADKTLIIWDFESGMAIGGPLTGHEGPVTSVAFSPDGKYIVSGSWDRTLRLWDAVTGMPIGEPLLGHEAAILSVAFSRDGRRVVSGSRDKTLRLWDAGSGEPIGNPFNGHEGAVLSVAFSPDGLWLISGSKDKTLRLWDANKGEPVGRPLLGHDGWVMGVAFSPDGRRIVSASDDRTLRFWNACSGTQVGKSLIGHKSAVTSVAYSADGRSIVSGSRDNTLRLWEGGGSQIGDPSRNNGDTIRCATVNTDGWEIASASTEHSLRGWVDGNGAPVSFAGEQSESEVLDLRFSVDGESIGAGDGDAMERLWPVLDGWADRLCKKLPRNLSRKEWRDWVSADIDYIEQCPGLPIPPDSPEPGQQAASPQP